MDIGTIILIYGLAFVVMLILFKMLKIIPEQQAWVVEQFGKYRKTLGSGFHFLIPFLQKIAYKHSLKEIVIDVPPQTCITQDNVQVSVDGILYLKVMDPQKASYGIEDYIYATSQLSQTTMRAEIGKIALDNTFSERDEINNAVVKSVDEASDPWGIKVTRYEIKNIAPTATVLEAMEQQMRAEREKRAEILESDGLKQAYINKSIGEKEEAINISKGKQQQTINEAEGRAEAINLVSEATAEGISMIAQALSLPKAKTALSLSIAEQYMSQLGNILEKSKVDIVPSDLAAVKTLIKVAGPMLKGEEK